MHKIYTTVLACVAFVAQMQTASAQCPSGRYTTAQFQVDTIKDVQYGSNLSTQDGTTMINLVMDIYVPKNDTMAHRPLIVYAHGGSFIGGTKRDDDMIYYCSEMAARGYVCASISYRLQSALALANAATAKEKMVKEVIAAAQDGKAAVRFFRKDAATSDTYKIDPNQIFFGGTSAGAVLGIHLAYLDSNDVIPTDWRTWAGQTGGFEGSSGNPGYPSTVKAVVSYAGAIGDVTWIGSNDVPFAEWHSHDDGTVPDSTGSPLGISYLPNLSGGRVMHPYADAVGTYNFYHQYAGSSHPPFAASGAAGLAALTEIRDETAAFLYTRILCNPAYVSGIAEIETADLTLSPNPTASMLHITSGKEMKSVDILDQLGRKVKTVMAEEKTNISISVNDLTKGVYFARVNGVKNSAVKKFIVE
ncbi:MAG: T9SS type A sorting domain-containing protein [Chitinophagales bacterium]